MQIEELGFEGKEKIHIFVGREGDQNGLNDWLQFMNALLDWSYNNIPSSHIFDWGFTGHEHLDQFELINMNGRVYDPALGRFFSPDPIIQAPANSQNYNRYSYGLNKPFIIR